MSTSLLCFVGAALLAPGVLPTTPEEMLHSIGVQPGTERAVCGALDHKDAAVRTAALQVVRKRAFASCRAKVASLASQESFDGAILASAETLASFGDKRGAMLAARRLIGRSRGLVVVRAAGLLAELGSDEGYEALLRAFDESLAARTYGSRELLHFVKLRGAHVVGVLAGLARSASEDIRLGAVETLVQVDRSEATDVLRARLPAESSPGILRMIRVRLEGGKQRR